jgi:hypothetical protein
MVVDWTTLLLGGLGGRQLDPTISSVLNSVGSKGHKGAKAEFGDQLQGLLGMLGLGRNVSPPPTQSTGSGFLTNPDMSLYADGADGGSGGPFDFKHATPPAAPESKGGATPKDSRIQFIQDVAGKGFSAGPVEGTVGDLAAGLAKGAGAGWTNPKKDAPAPPAPKLTQGEKDAEEKKKKDEDAQKEKDKKAAKEKEDAAAKEKDEKDKEAKKSIVDPDDKYVDPDAASSSTVTMPSPGEIEAKLNQRKRPVNPDGGAQPSQVDTSSPPPHHSGLDPTVAYFDGDGSTLVVSGTLSSKLTGAPIDHVPGWQPFTPEANPKRGGSTPNTGKPWPN